MKLILLLTCISLFVFLNVCDGAKILAVFPTPSYSRQMVYNRLTNELAERGHKVTILTTDPIKMPHQNLRQIDLSCSYKRVKEIIDYDKTVFTFGPYMNYHIMADVNVKLIKSQLEHPDVQKLINDKNESYDLVITELVGHTPIYAFAEHFNAPLIGISSLDTIITTHDSIGNPSHSSINTDINLKYDTDLTFLQRFGSFLHMMYIRMYTKYVVDSENDGIIRKFFGSNASKSEELKKKIDLLMINANPVFDNVRPIVPATIMLGGLHIRERKQLPENLQTFMDKSKNGVIYFNLGENMNSEILTLDIMKMFMETFKGMKYNVIMKWESETMENKPANVLLAKWLPQQDLLVHPNVKLYITKGGQQSIEESVDSHVPMLVLPFCSEQFPNGKKIVRHGIGMTHLLEELTAEKLKDSIVEIIDNPMYKQNITKLDKLMKDTPMKPLERAIWWTEYLLRHKSAKHIQFTGANMSGFQYYCLDVIGMFVLMIALIYFLLAQFFEFLNVVCKREGVSTKTKYYGKEKSN